MEMRYLQYYDLENYLLKDVSGRFAKTGKLEPFDFYCILVWKSNRAKTKQIERLTAKAGSFSAAVEQIAVGLQSRESQEKLKFLMQDWGFLLSTASAILSILYPTVFTVYDVRVCRTLTDFKGLGAKLFDDSLWKRYQEYIEAVRGYGPAEYSLREKDRNLWAKSFFEDARERISGANTSARS